MVMKSTAKSLALSLLLASLQVTVQANAFGKRADAATNPTANKTLAQFDSRNDGRGNRCSERSLRGDYAIAFDGVVNGVGPVATLGVITLDGRGAFTINDTASFNGFIVDRVGSGSYTVNANCTGNATVTYTVGQPGRQATFNFVLIDGGREVQLISTVAGAVVSGNAKSLSSK